MKKTISIVLTLLFLSAMTLNIKSSAIEQADESSSIIEDSQEISSNPIEQPDEPLIVEEPEITDVPDNEPTDYTEQPDAVDFNQDIYEPATEYIPVEDIELSDFETEMFVKDTQNLSATVFPSTATEQTVRYSSSNSSVAKVTLTGKLTAIGKGTCRIYVSCDNYSVYYDLRVKVKTDSIDVKSKYIVIKPNEQINLGAVAQPQDASQVFSFKSNDEEVATVDSEGVITAKSFGSTSIIISNEDSTTLVNVIVSTDSEKTSNQNNDNHNLKEYNEIDALAKQIKDSADNHLTVKELSIVSSDALKELYGTDKVLTIEYPDYNILINGRDIINPTNEIYPELNISIIDNGIIINYIGEREMPGAITILLKSHLNHYRYLYLLGDKGDHTELSYNSDYRIRISSPGKYMLSTKNMNGFKFNIVWILLILGLLLTGSVIYIFTKKKYWLW
ncbi:MAG: Ig-like domain-containing protein [Ruminococcus sp.]|nr:Ig-like domain-containing protein [Ruminococcus sp.]